MRPSSQLGIFRDREQFRELEIARIQLPGTRLVMASAKVASPSPKSISTTTTSCAGRGAEV
jgi:hypothetical protein